MRGRPRKPTSTRQELLNFFAAKRKKPVVSKKEEVPRRRRLPYIRLPLEHKKLLIRVYYGSMTDFTVPKIRKATLARIFSVSGGRLASILRAFDAQGRNLEKFIDRRSEAQKPFKALEPIKDVLREPRVL